MLAAKKRYMKRITSLITSLIMVMLLAVPAAVCAEDGETETNTLRVGWHEVPYFITDENGRKSGYTYDYQCKLAAYTGWDYEYVEGTYSELLQKLMDGEIDMLGNVSLKRQCRKASSFARARFWPGKCFPSIQIRLHGQIPP